MQYVAWRSRRNSNTWNSKVLLSSQASGWQGTTLWRKRPILLLLGRDILSVHKVREQYNGPGNTPYAQRLDLGWVIVGEVCMGGVHKYEIANVFRTNILQNGHTSFFPSCSKGIQVKEQFGTPIRQYQSTLPCYPVTSSCTDHLGDNVFQKTPSDDKLSLSVEDADLPTCVHFA